MFAIIGMFYAISKEGLSASVVTNISWALINIVLFMPFILSSFNLKASPLVKRSSEVKELLSKINQTKSIKKSKIIIKISDDEES
jgi:hypothetical protein